MLLRPDGDRAALRRALLAAIAAHRHDTLRDLVALRSDAQVAAALTACSSRVVDDLLSLLPHARRDAIRRHVGGSALRRFWPLRC
jgi:hypothetical protein